MQYRQTTYQSITATVKVIELSDTAYGEWIVYEDNVPKYHINIFDDNHAANTIIKSMLDQGQNIEDILIDINRLKGLDLSLGKRPLFSTKKNSELIEINLSILPDYLLKNIY